MFDVHVHFNSNEIYDELETNIKEIKETFNANYKAIVVGYDDKSNQRVIELINKFDFMYGAIGIHPSDCKNYDFSMLEKIKNEILENKKIVAIGEIGLDFYWDKNKNVQELQRIWFEKQIELAKELNLPIEIHTRDAIQETFDIIKESKFKNNIILHCYNASIEITKEYLKMDNVYFSFGGVLTFKNSINVKNAFLMIPNDRILIETDAPYLSPVPYRGQLNRPVYIKETLKYMAELKKMSVEELEEILDSNAKTVFKI